MSLYSDYEPTPFREWQDTGVWTTQEGKQIPYSELTDEHLKNIVAKFNTPPEGILQEHNKRFGKRK